MSYYLIHRKNYYIPILCIILRSVFKVIDSMTIYYLHHQIAGSGMKLKSKPSLRNTSGFCPIRFEDDECILIPRTSDSCSTRNKYSFIKLLTSCIWQPFQKRIHFLLYTYKLRTVGVEAGNQKGFFIPPPLTLLYYVL